MWGTLRRSVALAVTVAVGLGMATPALAETGFEIAHHIVIFGGEIDPWSGGQALVAEKHFSARTPDFAIKVNPQLSPLPALAEALGVPFEPPRIGYADLSGQIHGRAGFNFGYSFGAGELSFIYPFAAQITLDSKADNELLAAGHTIEITTGFAAGLPQPLAQPLCSSRSVGVGGGCAVSEAGRALLGKVYQPDFRTTFTDARAFADFDYDVGAGLAATVGIAKVGSYCFSCFTRRFTVRDARIVPLIDVSPQSVFVAGVGRQDLFPATFPTPYGNIYANLPQPRVGKERMEGAGMSGEEEPTVIAFEAAVEKLVPVLGPLLSNNVGPLGYTLLETQGGPSLNLVQSFRFTVTPMVTLRFSHTVALEQRPGSSHSEITLPLGQSVRIRASESARGPFAITPTYWLDVSVKNSTKLALGLGVTARVLKLSLGGLDAGPFGKERFHEPELIGTELCCDEYPLKLAKATAAPIRFMLAGQLEGSSSRKVQDGGYGGLDQPLPPTEPPLGDQHIPDPEMQQELPQPPSYGSIRIGDKAIVRNGPGYFPQPPAPPPAQDLAPEPESVGTQNVAPPVNSPADIHRGPQSNRERSAQPFRRRGDVRGQNTVEDMLGGRRGDVNLETSPTVTQGEMTVYIAGIAAVGMRTRSSAYSTTIVPHDMTPKVIHALREMGALEDVSTTDKDPRIISDQLERRP